MNQTLNCIDLKKRFQNWMNRFHRVLFCYRNNLIKESELFRFQIFLLDAGQLNSNFTLDNLFKLDYPLTPFSSMHWETYVRTEDSWMVDVLREIYRKDLATLTKLPHLFPIFLNSPSFWQDLKRHVPIFKADEITTMSPTSLLDILHEFGNDRIVIEVNLNSLHHIEEVKNKLKHSLSQYNYPTNQLDPLFFFAIDTMMLLKQWYCAKSTLLRVH